MYFKILYKLQGFGEAGLDDCASEYITGYANPSSVDLIDEGGGVYSVEVTFSGSNIPKKVCRDFFGTQRRGMVNFSGNCDPSNPGSFDDTGDAVEVIMRLLGFVSGLNPISATSTCANIDRTNSYLRVPMIQAKRGGGVRVKRLLMYNPSSPIEEASLYGKEYFYQIEHNGRIISSGVASNEPAGNREENPLVNLMDRYKQGFGSRIFAGKDRKEMEGPLGEFLLPGAEVNYSRVVCRDIHQGKSTSGYTVNEYYSYRDYPVLVENSTVNHSQIYGEDNLIPAAAMTGVINFSLYKPKLTQGFTFQINSMNGKQKSIAHYEGIYDVSEGQEPLLFAKEVFEYHEPEAQIPVVKSPLSPIEMEYLGTEMDVSRESKAVKDDYQSLAIDSDNGVSIYGLVILPWLSASPSYSSNTNHLYTHVTSKVVRSPSVLKSHAIFKEGAWHKTEHIAYDFNTGQPVITRSYDDFTPFSFEGDPNPFIELETSIDHQGFYTSFNFPASSIYESMGQMSDNERVTIKSNENLEIRRLTNQSVELALAPGADPSILCDALNTFGKGDLIQVLPNEGSYETDQNIFHINGKEGNILTLSTVSFGNYTEAAPNSLIDLFVIKSGKTNELSEQAGHLITYGNGVLNEILEGIQLPVPANIVDRNNLATDLNGLLSSGEGSSINGANISQNLNFDFGNGCTTFPDDYVIKFENGSINIYEVEVVPWLNLCNATKQNMADYLNEYFERGFNLLIEDPFISPSNCQNASAVLNGATHYYNKREPDSQSPTEPELADLANEIFSRSILDVVDEQVCPLIEDNYNLGFATYDLFEPVFYDDEVPITCAGNTEPFSREPDVIFDGNDYRNKRVIVRDILGGCGQSYFVLALDCNQSNPTTFDIVYGETSNPNNYQSLDRIPYGEYDGTLPVRFDPFPGDCDGDACISFNGQCVVGPGSFWWETVISCDILASENLICSYELPDGGLGNFSVSAEDHQLEYFPANNPCAAFDVNCLIFCGEPSAAYLENVVSASFQTFTDESSYGNTTTPLEFAYLITSMNPEEIFQNPYQRGMLGKWRSGATYLYENDLGLHSDYGSSVPQNYNRGVFSMPIFDWNNPAPPSSSGWKRSSVINGYTLNGFPREEENILGNESCVKYGYDKDLPYLIAQNSGYSSCLFESFETRYFLPSGTWFEDNIPFNDEASEVSGIAHTGDFSLRLKPSETGFFTGYLPYQEDLLNQGIYSRVWVYTDSENKEAIAQNLKFRINKNGYEDYDFQFVTHSGEWSLYECLIPPAELINGQQSFIYYDFTNSGDQIIIDDLRIQPQNSTMRAIVYESQDNRIVAELDDQNFALLFQYSTEGKLKRKLKETERGIKTFSESNAHVPYRAERNED